MRVRQYQGTATLNTYIMRDGVHRVRHQGPIAYVEVERHRTGTDPYNRGLPVVDKAFQPLENFK